MAVRTLGELERRIMALYWSAGTDTSSSTESAELTVHDVVAGLHGRAVAYTTAMTVIERLREKGLLQRRREGRSFLYSATCGEDDYAAGLMNQVLESSADRGAALLQFAERLHPDEVAALRRALDRGGH